MKCPLSMGYYRYNGDDQGFQYQDCITEDCARYDGWFQECVDITIAEQLRIIANALVSISVKMSTRDQFMK